MLTVAPSKQYAPQRSVAQNDDANAWALVLAAGEGSRLKALTVTPSGAHVPKQFCSLLGGPLLVREALNRAESIAPRERVCTIVAAQHRRWWKGLPEHLPTSNVIVQPENRGTANGILLALTRIAERDGNARILVLPADHHVQDEPTLADSLRCSVEHLRKQANEIVFLGIAADEPDPELGYIVPGDRPRHGTFEIVQFVEKPTVPRARELMESGALWNAFIVAATAQGLLSLFGQRFPEIVDAMRDAVRRDLHRPDNPIATAELYGRLPSLDFSRDVLSNEREASLRVLPVPRCGWSDLGNVKRIANTLRQVRTGQRLGEPFGTSTQINLAVRLEDLLLAEKPNVSSASVHAG